MTALPPAPDNGPASKTPDPPHLVAPVSEATLRLIVENSRDGIHQLDLRTGRYTFMSRSQEELTGFARGELVGMSAEDAAARLHPDDVERVDRYLDEVIRGDDAAAGASPVEYRWRVRSGEYRWFSDSRRAIRDAEGRAVALIGVSRDITERKRAEALLELGRDELQRLNETLEARVRERTAEAERRASQLRDLHVHLARTEERERRRVAEVLHDGLQQLLVGVTIHLGRAKARASEAVHPSIDRAIELVGEAIEASRSVAMELSPPVLHERGLADALRWLAWHLGERYDLRVDVRAEDLEVESDTRTMLYQAARELLFNVVKHAGTDRARVEFRRDSDLLLLSVTDDGDGFDPGDGHSIVDTGAGLGLFALHQRCEAVGGTSRVTSAPGRGTRVELRVPRIEVVDVDGGRPSTDGDGDRASEADGDGARGPLRVLVADDHDIVRDGLVKLLDDYDDIEVVAEAADGEEAVTLTDRHRPDVIVMDVNMPRLDGIAATRRIVAAFPTTRVIGLSMHESREVEQAMLAAGAVAYVRKDAPIDDLAALTRAQRTGD